MTILGFPLWAAGPLVFVLVGLGGIGWAGAIAAEEAGFLMRSVAAEGRVVRLEPPAPGLAELAIVAVEVPGRGVIEFAGPHLCAEACRLGETMPLRLDPDHPADSRREPSDALGAVIGLGVFGLGFTLMGGLFMWIARRDAARGLG